MAPGERKSLASCSLQKGGLDRTVNPRDTLTLRVCARLSWGEGTAASAGPRKLVPHLTLLPTHTAPALQPTLGGRVLVSLGSLSTQGSPG